jgi:SAM-dependent methyltransferase
MNYESTLHAAEKALGLTRDKVHVFHDGFSVSVGCAPLPPADFMVRVGSHTLEQFLFIGDQWGQIINRLMKPKAKILDLGSGCGKPARLFLNHSGVAEYVGIDSDAELVSWCNVNLRPASSKAMLFTWVEIKGHRGADETAPFATNAIFPLEPNYFNFVIAGSLFTHLTMDESANYLKQARLACIPGAQFLLTLHIEPENGNHSGDAIRADYTIDTFCQLAEQAGWGFSTRMGELCGQELLLFHAV